jgi:hypothetical protein
MTIEEIDPKAARGFEVLVNTGLITLGGEIGWRQLKKFSPRARFPVVIAGDHAFRADEVLDVRRLGGRVRAQPVANPVQS